MKKFLLTASTAIFLSNAAMAANMAELKERGMEIEVPQFKSDLAKIGANPEVNLDWDSFSVEDKSIYYYKSKGFQKILGALSQLKFHKKISEDQLASIRNIDLTNAEEKSVAFTGDSISIVCDFADSDGCYSENEVYKAIENGLQSADAVGADTADEDQAQKKN